MCGSIVVIVQGDDVTTLGIYSTLTGAVERVEREKRRMGFLCDVQMPAIRQWSGKDVRGTHTLFKIAEHHLLRD